MALEGVILCAWEPCRQPVDRLRTSRRFCSDAHQKFQWRDANPNANRESARRARARFAFRIAEIKLVSGCVDCGYRANALALEFDHVRGVKRFSVATGLKFPWADVLAEIAKCEVRCSNCHAIVTAHRRSLS